MNFLQPHFLELYLKTAQVFFFPVRYAMRLSHIYRILLEKKYTTLVDAAYFKEKENVLTQSTFKNHRDWVNK